MHPLIGYIIIIGIVVTGIALVMTTGFPVVDKVKNNVEFREAEEFFIKLDNAIRDVSREGEGSSRLITTIGGDFRAGEKEDLIEFRQTDSIFDYLVRKETGNSILLSGGDVSCYEADINGGENELIMENSYIGIAFNKVNGSYNTKNNILMIKSKDVSIRPVDSSFVIDGDVSTSSGNGYSALEITGQQLPKCRVRYYMNSTVQYEIIYTLYNGADFVVAEVINVS